MNVKPFLDLVILALIIDSLFLFKILNSATYLFKISIQFNTQIYILKNIKSSNRF